jgi:hypothetical protein
VAAQKHVEHDAADGGADDDQEDRAEHGDEMIDRFSRLDADLPTPRRQDGDALPIKSNAPLAARVPPGGSFECSLGGLRSRAGEPRRARR